MSETLLSLPSLACGDDEKTPPALKPAVLWDAQRGAAGTDDVLPVPGQIWSVKMVRSTTGPLGGLNTL